MAHPQYETTWDDVESGATALHQVQAVTERRIVLPVPRPLLCLEIIAIGLEMAASFVLCIQTKRHVSVKASQIRNSDAVRVDP